MVGGSPGCQGSGVAPRFLYLHPVMAWRAKRAGLLASSQQEDAVSDRQGMASDGLEVASTQQRG